MNPFLEGVILILVGVVVMVVDKIWAVGIHDMGVSITSIGVGYVGKTAVEHSNGGPNGQH